MDSSQFGSKITALEAKVATLEDEGKIIKGEIKNVLTEIRTAILARNNPFEADHGSRISASAPAPIVEAPPHVEAPRPTQPEPVAEPEPEMDDGWAESDGYSPAYEREPVRMVPQPAPPPPAPAQHPDWSLLTIASLSAWAEEAMRRLGALRLEILLDLCEAAGHLTPDARSALSRVTELDVASPQEPPSTNETVVILRQLDALLNDEHEDYAPLRLQRR